MIIIGTTISLVLTIVAAQLLERHQRANDRRLSALMVMASIDKFANDQLESLKKLEKADSICTWLLSVPPEELELLPETELGSLMNRALYSYQIIYDRAAENVFSSTLETLKYKCSKVLRNETMRESMELKHNKICYMRYNANYLLYMNKKNMEAIGISKEELDKFIEESQREIVIDAEKPNADDYYTRHLDPDSITTVSVFKAHLDSIKASMNIK